MRINQNISAMNTYSRLTAANNAKAGSLAKLSSGLRINRAGDDAAGLAISEKMRGQVGGLKQSVRNAQDGISLIQTAEGALNETHSILNRMRELAVQSSNDTNTDADRGEIQKEMNELATEISRISRDTEFNTQNLLGGKFNGTFHIGANKGQNLKLEIADMSSEALNVSGSGEGKANYEITGGDLDSGQNAANLLENTAIVDGENKLNVVKLDNVSVGSETTASNYGLQNDKGEIVAVSNDAKTYKFLKEATKVDDLGSGALSAVGTDITFADEVTSGEVTFKAAQSGTGDTSQVDLTEIKATASIDVSGLQTGEYTAKTIDATNFADYFGTGKIEVAGTNPISETEINSVLLDSEGNVAAVEFKVDGSVNTGVANKYYAVDDLKLDTAGAGASLTAGEMDTVINGAEAIMTKGGAVAFTDGDTLSIKADGGIDVSTQEAADAAIATIDEAISNVSAERSKLGATQNRLDHTINNLTATAENLSEAESRIRDVDMAEEMMAFTKNNILSQAATSMLAQANQMPQSVLQLLQ